MFATKRVAGLIAALALPVLAAIAGTSVAQPAGDSFDRLPETEMPGRQIGWTKAGTLEAFTKAVENGKPMVVVFGSRESGTRRSLPKRCCRARTSTSSPAPRCSSTARRRETSLPAAWRCISS